LFLCSVYLFVYLFRRAMRHAGCVLDAYWMRMWVCAGTAVVVCPVGSLTYDGNKTTFCGGEKAGPVCQELYDALMKLQTEQAADPDGWVVPLSDMQPAIDAAAKA
jgi:hypothetical protein